MDKKKKQQLEKLYKENKIYDQQQEDRIQRWRNMEPESIALLATILRAMHASHVLEIGTSNGYSTIWLADAMQATGGHVTSLEMEADRTALAMRNLEKFDLLDRATLITCDAANYLSKTSNNFDLILLDAERKYYCEYWLDLKRLLLQKPHSLLVVDNVLSHAEQVADFISLIVSDEKQFMATTVPIGAGLLFVTTP